MNSLSKDIAPEIEDSILRCFKGKTISRKEANYIIEADNSYLPILMATSSAIRDSSNEKKISYSKNVFIPLTNICSNMCKYCGFRRDPIETDAKLMTPSQVVDLAQRGDASGCHEALFCLGEKPEKKYEDYLKRLRKLGYENTIEYLYNMCEAVFKKTNLFPHSNPGLIEKNEMKTLREFNASLGLMLESASNRLCEKGGPHELSPGKVPKLRLDVIEHAGQLKIPFTTGLLIGIGESDKEIIDSLFAIKKLHIKYDHIQEIIIQNFKAEPRTEMGKNKEPAIEQLLKIVIVTRLIFGKDMSIQVPPNLNTNYCELFILAGIDDWGGISPITTDFINPDFPWPKIEDLEKITKNNGFDFKERLPIYPKYIRKSEFMSKSIKDKVFSLADNEGYVRRSD